MLIKAFFLILEKNSNTGSYCGVKLKMSIFSCLSHDNKFHVFVNKYDLKMKHVTFRNFFTW